MSLKYKVHVNDQDLEQRDLTICKQRKLCPMLSHRHEYSTNIFLLFSSFFIFKKLVEVKYTIHRKLQES